MPTRLEDGDNSSKPRSNGLHRLAGTWSDEDHSQFVKALDDIETLDYRDLAPTPVDER